MTINPATNSQGGEAVSSSQAGVVEADSTSDASAEIENEALEGDEPKEPAEPDTDEVEHEGKKYRVPKAVKPLMLMHGDYTRKTQEVSELRKSYEEKTTSLAQREKFHQEHIKSVARVEALSDRLAEYEKLDWSTIRAQDAQVADKLWFDYQLTKDNRDKAQTEVKQKEQSWSETLQRDRAKQFQEASVVLQREIKGWSPELAGKLATTAKDFGFTDADIGQISDPRLIKVLHAAYEGGLAAKKLAAKEKAASAEAAQPLPQVGTNANANQRRTTDASGDRLSDSEWIKREEERVRKRNSR